MSDQQLLDLAAKAAMRAGLKLECPDELDGVYVSRCSGRNGYTWNPLEDDGDALRLAMKLGICIQFIPECDTACAYQERSTTGEPFNVHVAGLGDIETRRVIAQAAAEIGKAMQEKH
ncbi:MULTISPECIES: hypothetical protein [Pseudomonas]|uniref:hypothetical protein n=1 Tax=Pseudomonas TaxID=286 RepID=UPI0006767FE3|nr:MULTISPECIES: hypothetical protein [Pseudomonas]MBO2889549.1 hypothetical protein [Pseudomonas asiatica]QUN70156.1 hypothetical protein KDB76_13090 [Pseudomonas sp. JS425]